MIQRLTFALACFLVALLATAVYFPGLHGPFVYDDLTNILYNTALRLDHLSLASLRDAALSSESGPLGRPVAMLSFALNYYFTHFDVFYFKLTNFLIHLLIGAGLYYLTRRLLRRHEVLIGPQTPPNPSLQIEWLSLAVCALWLVHPLNLTAVLYVVQRMTSLATLFTVLGLLGYVQGREQIILGRRRGFLTITASLVLFGALAIFSKESGVLLPLYAMVIEVIFYRFAAHSDLIEKFRWFWIVLFVAPLVVVAGILLIDGGKLLNLSGYQVRDFTLTERLLSESRVLWFYLTQILVPNFSHMGSYHDDFVISRGLLDPPTTLASIIGLGLLAGIAVLARRKYILLTFAITWFFVGHSLESTVVPLLLVQEHRNYLPLYGILLAVVYYLASPSRKVVLHQKFRYALLALYLALVAGATYARSTQWANEWTLYHSDVSNHPMSSRAHTMLGILEHDNYQNEEATKHFVIAAVLSPREIDPMIRLVQHLFLSQSEVSQELLDEMDLRVQHAPYTNVTLWTFEALLKDTRKNPAFNHKMAVMYEKLIDRPDIRLEDAWRENAYRVLASNYRDTRNFTRALYFYSKAAAMNDKAFYALASADIYVKLKKTHEAQRFITEVKTKNLPLNDSDRLEMNRLETLLHTPSQPTRKH